MEVAFHDERKITLSEHSSEEEISVEDRIQIKEISLRDCINQNTSETEPYYIGLRVT